MRNAVVSAIHEAAQKDPRIYFLSGDGGRALMDMFEDIPDRVLNCGMAEQNLIGAAAGLALSGMKVFVYGLAPFVTLRCLEQIKVDVAYHNLDVTILGSGAGFVYGTCGPTHYSIEDIAALRALPNMKIVVPANPMEAGILTEQIIEMGGPAYIRLNKAKEPNPSVAYVPRLGKGFVAKEGSQVSIISTGALLDTALESARLLDAQGWSVEVINMHTVKPLDVDLVSNRVQTRAAIVTLEEHNIFGGLGSAIAEVFAESRPQGVVFKRFGIPDAWPHVIGTQNFLRGHFDLSPVRLAEQIGGLIGR
jgi:transketolase